MILPGRIISGGQTGVDRAALDFAIERGIPWGGWAPKGWRSEDGTIPERYREHMREHASADYLPRTHANVVDSAATLIVAERRLLDARGKFTGGTRQTAIYAHGRTPLSWTFIDDERPGATLKVRYFVDQLAVGPVVLNIAGPRESKAPGIYAATLALLREVWP